MATIHTPVTGDAVLVYTPPSTGIPKVTLINEGASIVYVGQAGVTASNGLAVAAAAGTVVAVRPVRLVCGVGCCGDCDGCQHQRSGERWRDHPGVRC